MPRTYRAESEGDDTVALYREDEDEHNDEFWDEDDEPVDHHDIPFLTWLFLALVALLIIFGALLLAGHHHHRPVPVPPPTTTTTVKVPTSTTMKPTTPTTLAFTS